MYIVVIVKLLVRVLCYRDVLAKLLIIVIVFL